MRPKNLLCYFAFAIVVQLGTAHGNTPIKVACIGDSITEGSWLSNPSVQSFPAKLQALLGSEYVVNNYGVSGRTLLRQGDFPYWNESKFQQSQEWNPDIVIIKLGTNDGKGFNWVFGDQFSTDFQDMIDIYANLPSGPRIVICTPCPVIGRGAFSINPRLVAEFIAPEVRALGAQLELQVIDLHSALAGHAEWFPDRVHPNSIGTSVIAALIRTALLGDAPTAPAFVEIERSPTNRALVHWPSEYAGYVLQYSPSFIGASTVWTVVDDAAVNGGATLEVSDAVSGKTGFYRLWNPASN